MKLNRIKAILAEKGISQTWLAKQLNKSFSMVNAYACNRIQPNLATLHQIAVILQVDVKDLITDKNERQTSINAITGMNSMQNIDNSIIVNIAERIE